MREGMFVPKVSLSEPELEFITSDGVSFYLAVSEGLNHIFVAHPCPDGVGWKLEHFLGASPKQPDQYHCRDLAHAKEVAVEVLSATMPQRLH